MEDWNYMYGRQMGNYLEFEALDALNIKPPLNFPNIVSSKITYNCSDVPLEIIPPTTKKTKKTADDSCSFHINPSITPRTISPKCSSPSSSEHFISFGDQLPFLGNLDSLVEPKNEIVFCEENSKITSPIYLQKSHGLYTEEINDLQQDGAQRIRRRGNMSTRSPSHALDHVNAERKRRENLSERIIALSALIPGLKKVDKASILGEAIKYLKHLQERVKQLEVNANKKSDESIVLVKNSINFLPNGNSSSWGEDSIWYLKESKCQIEARISENNILIRLQCEKKKGFVVKMIKEIERLNLTMVNSSVLPFGDHNMDITIVAQIDAEYTLSVEDLVKKLRSTLS